MKMSARKIIPAALLLVTFCHQSFGPVPLLLANEKYESETYTPPPGRLARAKANLELVNFPAMRLAIEDLAKHFPEKYTNGREYLKAIDAWQQRMP